MNICIIGGSGAIGQALACQLRDQGHQLTATYRSAEPKQRGIRWIQVDILDEQSIAACFAGQDQLDWVINAVGILHSDHIAPEKTIRRFSPANFADLIAVNTAPTLTIAKHAMPLLRRSHDPKFAAISARVGSIGDNRLGGWYSYRCSKAALNMAIKTLALEWKHAIPKAVVAALHPGTVASALSKPFSANQAKIMTPTQSARCLIDVLSKMTSEDTGQFRAWDHSEIVW